MPLTAFAGLILLAGGRSSDAPDQAVMDRIRDEGLNHSQLMQTLSYLTDVIGQRLTGSPSLKHANDWTCGRLSSWGLYNAHLEAWGPFGRGWQLERFSAQIVEPYDVPLLAYPKAWSPSAHGTAEVVLVDATDAAGLEKYKGQLKGKIVLSGPEQPITAQFKADASRLTDEELKAMADDQGAPQGRARPGGQGQRPPANARTQAAFGGTRLRFFLQEGALAVIDGARGNEGTVFVQQAAAPPPVETKPADPNAPPVRPPSVWDKSAPKTVAQVSVSAETYNRMVRMVKQGAKLKIDLDLKVSFFNKDLNVYNTVAELPGTDLKDQIVMCGGHMDSWQSGTGATDNGAGTAVAMEAMRILKALDLHPRRTIRVALWSGEEQGLFGSRNYVAQHFGSYANAGPGTPFGGGGAADRGALTTKPEFDKISAYFNLDNGSGKIRGIYCQSNPKVIPIFTDWLAPFKDLGASTVTIRNTGSTDHVSFDAIGIPGFEFIQDPIEYGTRTHHSNQDVFDRVQGDDLKQASVIMAAFLYNAAMRDEMIPRKTATSGS